MVREFKSYRVYRKQKGTSTLRSCVNGCFNGNRKAWQSNKRCLEIKDYYRTRPEEAQHTKEESTKIYINFTFFFFLSNFTL